MLPNSANAFDLTSGTETTPSRLFARSDPLPMMNHVSTPARLLQATRIILTCSSLALGNALSAQNSPVPNTKTEASIIELNPFVVNTATDVGYAANTTLAGSRLRTNLSDIPNAISVFTQEFMSDINATSEADLMLYSASAVPERTDQTAGVQGIAIEQGGFNFRVRGQVATRTRNYFDSNLIPDTYNSERFEEARGPNAILFGLGGAGGILNTSTKRALLAKDLTEIKLTTNDDNQLRATVDHNLRLNKRLALRFNGLSETSDGWRPHEGYDNERLHIAGTFRPWTHTTIHAEAEWGSLSGTLTRNFAALDNVSQWKLSGATLVGGLAAANTGLGIGKYNNSARITYVGNDGTYRNFQQTVFSQPQASKNNSHLLEPDWIAFDPANPYPRDALFSGEGGRTDVTQRSVSVFLNTEPVKNLFLEVAATSDSRTHDVYDTTHTVNSIFGEPGTTYRDGTVNPYAGDYYIESRWVLRSVKEEGESLRATAAYQLELGKFGRHSFSALASRSNNGRPNHISFLVAGGAPFNANVTNGANQVRTRYYVTDPRDLAQYAAPDYRDLPQTISVITGTSASAAPNTYPLVWEKNTISDSWRHLHEYLFAWQGYFLKDRIVTTAGYRHTTQDAFTRNNSSDANGRVFLTADSAEQESFSFHRISYGVVAKATPWLSGFYNFAQNGKVPNATFTLIPDDRQAPLNAGEGTDYGIMLNLLENRLTARFGYYTNNSVDQQVVTGSSAQVGDRNTRINEALIGAGRRPANTERIVGSSNGDLADVESQGYELNVTANITPSWRLILSASKNETVTSNMLKAARAVSAVVKPTWEALSATDKALITSAGVSIAQEIANFENFVATQTAVEGQSTIGQRELEFRLFSRYDFRTGPLKGFYTGGGFRYGSRPVVGKSSTGALFYSPVNREVDLLFGYRPQLWGALRKVKLELQLNAQSILQQEDYTILQIQADGQLSRVQLNAPPSYSLAAAFKF